MPDVDLVAAYYGYGQNGYATGPECRLLDSAKRAGCSGKQNAVSVLGDYRFTKRFDVYAGSMWSEVQDGLANGFLNKDNIATTVGLRFKF